ncbi:hypothetical protein L195_g060064, partial [Trifolium pratense]
ISDHVLHQNLVMVPTTRGYCNYLNVDGSLMGSSQSAGFGELIRNNDGTFLGGFYGVASQPSILYAEIMVLGSPGELGRNNGPMLQDNTRDGDATSQPKTLRC